MTEKHKNLRLWVIQDAPFTKQQKDLLTSADFYFKGALDTPLIEFLLPCYPSINKNISDKIEKVWICSSTCFHLMESEKSTEEIKKVKELVSHYYSIEAQRILGSLFTIEDTFWETFYKRQINEINKPLVAIDALHQLSVTKDEATFQLLTQCIKSLHYGYYTETDFKKSHIENAYKMIENLPLDAFKDWMNKLIL